MKILLILMTFLSFSSFAKSNSEKIGDIFLIAIPLTAYGATLYQEDEKGQIEFYKSFGTTLALTYALKYSVKEKRPDNQSRDSFPSGHASSTFAGATFIHQRYDLKYAIIPYFAAIYTAYSRVDAHRHHPTDVYAGAAIGILSNLYFVTPYKHVTIEPMVDNNYQGLIIGYQW